MYYSVIGIIAIIINFIINHDVWKKRKDTVESDTQKAYRYFIWGITAYLVTDMLWGFCEALGNPVVLYLDTVVYYIAMYSAVLLWAKYVVAYLDDYGTFGKALLLIGNILFVLELVALVANHFVHFFFWVDELGQYHAYAFRHLALAVQIALFFATSVYVFNRSGQMESAAKKERHIAIGVFGISMGLAILIQMNYPLLPIYSIGYMIGICVLHTYVIEGENAELRRKADEANKAKSAFLFNISHDIRTPMNAITGFTAMAKKYIDDREKVTDYLHKIDISGKQLLDLVNQVLEMSRIESGRLEFEEQPVNVKEKFETMVSVISSQANVYGLNFYYSLRDAVHLNVLADEARMGQITLNIIGNALKYTPEGGRVDFILQEIPCEKDGWARYVFSVADTGIGMSREYLQELFEPFTRENSSTVNKIQGTGLGMSIVKNLVDLLGGTIEVQSELGKGSRFDVTLDFKIDETAENNAAEQPVAPTVFDGKRVLLVEDNELNREIAKDILEEFGLTVEEADDGDVAVVMVTHAFDRKEYSYYNLILMDIQMPTLNGYDATRAIRKLAVPDGFHLPIVAMTANAFEEDRRNALAAGMDEHLAKPIEIAKLVDTLAKFLR